MNNLRKKVNTCINKENKEEIMKRDKLFIYIGTVVFFLLAIALGIIMYMLSRTAGKLENDSSQISSKSNDGGQEISESVSSEIGKTVEEQENTSTPNIENTQNTQNTSNTSSTSSTEVRENVKNTETKASDAEKTVEEPKETKKEITFVNPVEGEIIGEYAKDNLIYSETLKEWITHTAIDIKADKTSVIKSAADGIVKTILNDPRYGLTVIVEHDDGYETVYSNLLTAEFVVEGEEIKQGQTIGTAGNTASFESSMECHLHFELLKDGEYLNPSIYLK